MEHLTIVLLGVGTVAAVVSAVAFRIGHDLRGRVTESDTDVGDCEFHHRTFLSGLLVCPTVLLHVGQRHHVHAFTECVHDVVAERGVPHFASGEKRLSVFPLAGLLVLIAGAFRNGEFNQIGVALVALRVVGESAFEGLGLACVKPSIEFVNYPSIADIGCDGTRIPLSS